MLPQADTRRLVDRILTLVHATKGAAAMVAVRSAREGNTRFAVNEITSTGDVERLSISLTVQFGQRSASATTNQVDDRSIDELVGRALRMARLAPENPEQMPLLGRQTYLAPKDPADPATAKLTPDARAKAVGVLRRSRGHHPAGRNCIRSGFSSHSALFRPFPLPIFRAR